MPNWDVLNDYQPQSVDKGGFDIIKAQNLPCGFNYARVESYSGPNADLQGTKWFNYELIVVDHAEHSGRRFWKRYNLDDEKQLTKLRDALFTIGMEFKDEAGLEACAEKLVTTVVLVRAWGWTPDGEAEARQIHLIKGVRDEAKTGAAPF